MTITPPARYYDPPDPGDGPCRHCGLEADECQFREEGEDPPDHAYEPRTRQDEDDERADLDFDRMRDDALTGDA